MEEREAALPTVCLQVMDASFTAAHTHTADGGCGEGRSLVEVGLKVIALEIFTFTFSPLRALAITIFSPKPPAHTRLCSFYSAHRISLAG